MPDKALEGPPTAGSVEGGCTRFCRCDGQALVSVSPGQCRQGQGWGVPVTATDPCLSSGHRGRSGQGRRLAVEPWSLHVLVGSVPS